MGRVISTAIVICFIFCQASLLYSDDTLYKSSSENGSPLAGLAPRHKDPIGKFEFEEPQPIQRRALSATPSGTSRPINPTAPNSKTKFLTGDFTDTDGDGMTDAAELKYGFNPYDPNSFPTEPDPIVSHSIEGTGISATYEVGTKANPGIFIRWYNPDNESYYLMLHNGTQQLYFGGPTTLNYSQLNLTGTEILTGYFIKYGADRQWVANYPQFTIDLSKIDLPAIGDPNNRITYSFKDFPAANELLYRDFLKKLFPIMYYYLGPPAETFNCVIENMGYDSGYFTTVDNGRTILTDTSFVPRLIAHEFVHVWKGNYAFSSDNNWDYSPELSGFEEATAEGMAFEIMHEFVRSYPNDNTTIQLLNWRPYQYWSSETTYYDSVRHNRDTGSGDFTDPSSLVYDKYSTAATTWQIMMKKNPGIYKDMMRKYFAGINGDPAWRPTRDRLLDLWAGEVPVINGSDLKQYLKTMPVFNGTLYDEGVYVLSIMRPYGYDGDQDFGVTYANKDGEGWWGIKEAQMSSYNLPPWLPLMYADPDDSYVYIYTQGQPYSVAVSNFLNTNISSYAERTEVQTGYKFGFGWRLVDDLEMKDYPLGLYRETVTFDNFIRYDPNSREDFYFFGMKGFTQNSYNEYVIMIGVDGVSNGSVHITIDNIDYVRPLVNGVAVFRSETWPFDMEGEFPIVITNSDGVSHTYYRTLLEAGSYRGFFQQQFIIIDKDFDGTEDHLQAVTTGLSAKGQEFHSGGGGGSVLVVPSSPDGWTAVSNSEWITINSGSPGKGKGTVYYNVSANTAAESRTGTITIYGKTVSISQAGTSSIIINSGAPYTNAPKVALSVSADSVGGIVDRMQFSHNANTWSAAEKYAITRKWTLPAGNGRKTVYARFKSGSGAWSSAVSNTITLDAIRPTGTISIDNGSKMTTSSTVTLTLNAIDASGVSQMQFSDGKTWSASEPYSPTRTYTLPAGKNPLKTVYVKFQDNAGNWSLTYKASIIFDNTPPKGTIKINAGAAATKSVVVKLTLSSTDVATKVTQMKFSNDMSTWSEAEAYATTKTWTMTSDEGTKTVYVMFRDGAGNWSDAISDTITLDTTAPAGSLTVAGGAQYTKNAAVTLALTGADGATQMQFSNDGNTWSTAEKFAPTKTWTLARGDGPKTVYVRFGDAVGNWSAAYSGSITLDSTAPTGAISINGGAATSTSSSVTLTLSASDATSGLDRMQFSANGTTWSAAEDYGTSKDWTLSAGTGVRTVYVRFIDKAGVLSKAYSDTITLK